ncbi:MAG: hypothetical protein IJ844_09305 [Prevotella sp.]|nr:hypothetical protein [Prevotella sp.]
MKTTFEWNRFCAVLRKDLIDGKSQYGLTLLVITLMPLLFWIVNLVLGDGTMIAEFRWTMIMGLTLLAAIFAPSRLYAKCNIPNEGIHFAMLPASKSEKFWSMVLCSAIIAPSLCFFGCIVLDFFLYMLPFGPYREPLFSENNHLLNPDWGFLRYLLLLMTYLSITSVFFFTATLFKRQKVLQTVLWCWLIGFVLLMVLFPLCGVISTQYDFSRWTLWIDNRYSPEQVLLMSYWCVVVFDVFWSALFYGLAARRLNRMKY